MSMALRDFLYPQLEVQLILARRLDVDEVHAGQGSLSKDYLAVAAKISLATRDAQRLGLKEGNHVEVKSKIGRVIVEARIVENQPEGLVVMQPSPWAFAVINDMMHSQGIKVTIKPSDESVTTIESFP